VGRRILLLAAGVRGGRETGRARTRIFESTMGSGTGVSRPVSSTIFLTVTERQATSFSTSKTSSCFDLSFTDVDSARRRGIIRGGGGGTRIR
jgi:hypothetical protein